MKRISVIYTVLSVFLLCACSKETTLDIAPAWVAYSQPINGATAISTDTIVFIKYSEEISIANESKILLNDLTIPAHVEGTTLYIDLSLHPGTSYTVFIGDSAISDLAGNYSKSYSFSFATQNIVAENILEAELADFSSGLTVQQTINGYSGEGYIGGFMSSSDYLNFDLNDFPEGSYHLFVAYSTSNWGSKKCMVNVNGNTSKLDLPESNNFSTVKFGKIKLSSSNNYVKITPDYTYFNIDYIQLIPTTDADNNFQIAEHLVSQSPTQETQNLYNFLKESFQNKIISGTMANYNTNIKEAEWVFEQTGKWPALVGFDLIDYTREWSWINYTELVDNAINYWDKNGLVAITWHWRDPLRTTDEFYTDKTSFDISKVNDGSSEEYKAMLADIDEIAKYLQQLKDANVPVLWRPLHEAAGTWFWWGAKGPESCVTLWKLLYNKLVNEYKLNNLIWVWTSDTDHDALAWYPGDDYVDIIGMDIYPGENQHGSQYIQFEKIKEIFNGRKLIALTECGSIPDPKSMMEFGDTWSWFMPWNGDFTRSEKHNGADWWNTIFSYNYVLTRDKMPDLKKAE